MQFKDGEINGIGVSHLKPFTDERGWLMELFRQDELDPDIHPVMSYASMTLPGVARGPHLHREQTDCFVFISSTFRLYLWDERPDSSTCGNRLVLVSDEEKPLCVIVPPGVVHAYKNTGKTNGLVLNFPNRLYAGRDKKQPVDEVRFEGDPGYGMD